GEDLVRGREAGAGILHLRERALRVARLDLDAAHGVLHNGDVEALPARVEDAVLDAVVGRKAGDEDSVDATLAEKVAESRVLEGRIALAVPVMSLVQDEVHLLLVEGRMKLRAGSPLATGNRPDRGRVGSAPLRRVDLHSRERAVVRAMAVARRDYEVEAVEERVDRARDPVALGDRQRAAGREVVLEVDDQEGVHVRNGMDLADGCARTSPDGLLARTGSYSRHAMGGAGPQGT